MAAAVADQAPCPACRNPMIYVTSQPHPKAPWMWKTTFVCYPCNRTRSYSLTPEMAAAYAPGEPFYDKTADL